MDSLIQAAIASVTEPRTPTGDIAAALGRPGEGMRFTPKEESHGTVS